MFSTIETVPYTIIIASKPNSIFHIVGVPISKRHAKLYRPTTPIMPIKVLIKLKNSRLSGLNGMEISHKK
jgi:hypothetical protein